MYYLALFGFFASVLIAYLLGEAVGRNAEQVAQRKRREWQYRLDNETRRSK